MDFETVKEWVTEAGLTARVLKVDDDYNGSYHNGYVQIPANSKLSDDSYNEHCDIEVHGGLTFDGDLDDDNNHWFGFDCAHLGDNIEDQDLDYMIKQCESLAKQLKERL